MSGPSPGAANEPGSGAKFLSNFSDSFPDLLGICPFQTVALRQRPAKALIDTESDRIATQTDKRTAGVFLDTLGAIAYKEIKKNGEFVLPGFGKLVKQKRKARTDFNPKTQQKINSSQDRRQISCCQSRKGWGFGGLRSSQGACPGNPQHLILIVDVDFS
jgi:nucleoid DNA-binding protein